MQAQVIMGKVVDATSQEPLPSANVFLNNTTIGTVTELNGDFTLKNVRHPAVYEVVFSFVGYEPFKMKVSLEGNDLKLGTISLKPSEIELGTLEVKGTKDTQWEKKVKKFKKVFLGEDASADLCSILNPWVIDFPEGEKGFKAVASAPIEIENKALGYKVTFYLANFRSDNLGYLIEGNVRFEELNGADQKEASGWAMERNKSFMHSRQHLFKAMIDHRIKGEGFNLYADANPEETNSTRSAFFNSELGKTIVPFDTANLVIPMSQKDIYKITLKGRLEVHYRKEKALVRTYRDVFSPVSWVRLNKNYVLVNKNGVELNPADVTISGAMNRDRVAHLLPSNYLPDAVLIEEQRQDLLPMLQEQIYVHTDKPYYYPGESLWFKGYVNYRAPSLRDSLSRTVYVELVDLSRKKVALTKTIEIDSGHFHGGFILPDSSQLKNYYLRAYTNLSRNFGEESVFVKPIPILGLTDKVDPQQKKVLTGRDSSLVISSDKTMYKVHDKITLIIHTEDDDGQPQSSNLSIAVTDAAQVIPLELSSTIVEGYPFKEIARDKIKENLPYPVEYGISFSGRFLGENNKPAKAMVNVLQLNPGNFTMAQSDEKGIFTIGGLTFADTASFSIQALNDKGQLYGKAELLKRETAPVNFSEINYQLTILKTEVPQRTQVYKDLSKDAHLLKEVVVKAKKTPEEYTMDYRIKRPYGKPDYVLKSKDINAAYGNLLLALPGKFPGLVVRQANNPGEEPRWVVYLQKASYQGGEVLVMVNDNFVGGDPGQILGAIDPSTVESVELKKGVNVLYGASGFNGVLSIYTKTDFAEEGVKIKKNVPIIKVPGYATPVEFSFPDYSETKTNSNASDFRSLVYWNPEITTDYKTGTATVSFFASDLSGHYCVTVEGVSQNGKPLRCVYFVEVADR